MKRIGMTGVVNLVLGLMLALFLALGAGMALAEVPPLISLAGLAALALLVAAVRQRQPRRTLIALLFFVAPISISKALVVAGPQFYAPGLYVTPGHLAVVLLALWLLQRALRERLALPLTRLDALVGVFCALVWARSFGTPDDALALSSALSYTLAMLAFYVASHTLKDAADLRLALRATLLVLVLQAIHAAAQMATHSPLPLPGAKALAQGFNLTFGGAGEAFRATGFLIHPNSLAHHMTLVLPPALALALLGRQLPRRVWLGALLALAIASVLLVLTLSRGGWASALAGAALVVVVFLRRGLLALRHFAAALLALSVLLMGLVAVYPQALLRLTEPDDRSTESRLLMIDQAATIIRAQPWAGVGFGMYSRANQEYTSPALGGVSADYQRALRQSIVHSHYLLLGAELGLPAMVFFVYLLWCWLRLPWQVRHWDDPATYALAIGLAGSMLANTVFLNSDNYYADIRVFQFWLAAGVLQALTLQAQRRASRTGCPGVPS